MFFYLLSLPFSCVFPSIFSCRPSVGTSSGHIVGLIVPANSSLILSGLGRRPECKFVFVSFFLYFLSSRFCFFPSLPFLCLIFRVCVYTMDMFLVFIRCKLYGMVYHSSLVPFPCVLVLRCTQYFVPCYFCFVFSTETLFVACFCDNGWI